MVMLVVDASAMVELLRRSVVGRRFAAGLPNARLAAPTHLDAEVFSALARMARADNSEEPFVAARLASLARLPITRYPCPPLLSDAWQLRANVAARDALYVVLARRLGAALATADARLARSPRLGIPVELVSGSS